MAEHKILWQRNDANLKHVFPDKLLSKDYIILYDVICTQILFLTWHPIDLVILI